MASRGYPPGNSMSSTCTGPVALPRFERVQWIKMKMMGQGCHFRDAASASPISQLRYSASNYDTTLTSSVTSPLESERKTVAEAAGVKGLHHSGLLCQDLQKSLDFYHRLLGFPFNHSRPDNKLPYGGAWLWVGTGMIHLMVLPNPDPVEGRPEHGGRDRHTCIEVADVIPIRDVLESEGISYTMSKSGRPAIFCRDPDGNALEFAQF
eukprot:TRINITY_DN1442_c0_g1_i1.p1 TRINITY_DN1442_c0_g1~~TRINITY_DN1442_c0_g1_i1.p1  ORF type:complete len:222 (+),score=30.40 TRINITY_DN1442_c0_g1_i1:45-668(+)